jgi:hypothetical protein
MSTPWPGSNFVWIAIYLYNQTAGDEIAVVCAAATLDQSASRSGALLEKSKYGGFGWKLKDRKARSALVSDLPLWSRRLME